MACAGTLVASRLPLPAHRSSSRGRPVRERQSQSRRGRQRSVVAMPVRPVAAAATGGATPASKSRTKPRPRRLLRFRSPSCDGLGWMSGILGQRASRPIGRHRLAVLATGQGDALRDISAPNHAGRGTCTEPVAGSCRQNAPHSLHPANCNDEGPCHRTFCGPLHGAPGHPKAHSSRKHLRQKKKGRKRAAL